MQPHGGYPPGPPHGYHAPGYPSAPQPAPGPGARVEVKVSYAKRTGCAVAIGVVFILFGIVAIAAFFLNAPDPNPLYAMPERPFPAPVLALVVLGLVFLFIPLLLTGEKSRIPRYIDRTGVTMRNGTHFPWQEYRGVRVLSERTRGGTQSEVGVEILFARGTALIRYRPIVNQGEVFWITDQLKQGRDPFAV